MIKINSSRNLYKSIAWLILAITFSGLFTSSTYAQTLSFKLEVVNAKAKATDRLDVNFTVTNNSSDDVHVLTWLTPLEEFNSEVFLVTRNGEKVEYIGRLVKRGAPDSKDYITLKPGKSSSNLLNLADAYAMYEPGDYQVSLHPDVEVQDYSTGSKASLNKKSRFMLQQPVSASPVVIKLLERRKALKIEPLDRGVKAAVGVPTFKNCTANQKDSLKRATSAARLISKVAHDSLIRTSISACPSARRYTMWFGAITPQRYQKVTENFSNINSALETQNLAFNCDCNRPGVFAYVYPNRPYGIWLCNAFWTAPTLGTDSRAGTLVHETSHFTIVADTDDIKYGQTGCKALAKSDPAKAIKNADSYEYYAEDTPPVPMP